MKHILIVFSTDWKSQDPPSISYQVIRRFIRTKGFESFFGLQLLADMLSYILQGRKPNQMTFCLPGDVKEEEKVTKETITTMGTDVDLKSEMKPENKSDKNSLERESFSSDMSDSTVLYNMDTSREIHDTKTDCDANKEDFFSSDSSSSSSSSGLAEEGISQRKKKKQKTKEKPKAEEEKNSEEEEDKELEKLLRMTDINPITRTKTSGSEEENAEQKQKENKNPKSKPEEVTLMDCLETENTNMSSQHDIKVEEEKPGNDFFSTINNQIKSTFLLSSDESIESSDECEVKQNPEEEGETGGEDEKEVKEEPKKAKKESLPNKRRKDDLAEFRVPNLSCDEESSGKEINGDSTRKDSSWKDDEVVSDEDSDDSVKFVHEFVKKRKRESTKNSVSTSDSDSGSDIQYCKTELSPTKGRKNIKKILKKENLQVETKQALKMETERKKRMKERRELFEKLFADADSKLVLDFDPQTKEELVVVDGNLVKQLKPHQKDGVRFMWNCCFESMKRLEEDSGSGCVLAHCMGLGKTLQVIALIHTIFTHNTGVHTALIISPLNTIRNWIHEFRMWQKNCQKKIKPFDLIPCKSKQRRKEMVRFWAQEGGVLIISYEMFRSFIKKDNKASLFVNLLLDPGPDLVVCDEGHVLKNSSSALSKCMSRIKTLRRIILTGTPLQNNLMEYYCMVQFVKPNILGTMKEFRNRFVHPINNGQFEDSTQLDVRLMKRRAHVLHTMLDGFVQRLGYYVLRPYLPEKQEYVISIALTETQENMYRLFIDECNQEKRELLRDFHWMQKVWTHPRIVMKASESNDNAFKRNQWDQYLREEVVSDIRSSGKLLLLFSILKSSKNVGDKVLVFSQSLINLDLIEYFLRRANCDYTSGNQTEIADSWVLGVDYSRLDGSTSSENRDNCCQKFNKVDDKRFRLLLVSTKAGGLGINLVAANRVIVFDVSWNPTHDVQSIFRVYRFGQTKPCYIYRFLAAATMEEKIYKRQVTKLSLAHRILDAHQIERHYTMGNLQELYTYDPIPKCEWRVPKIPKDNLFAEILVNWRDVIVSYHEHDSLLENKEEEELTEEERQAAWEDFEKEKLTPVYPKLVNGNSVPPLAPNIVSTEMQMVYDKSFTTAENSKVSSETDNQMCRIVDVRTLHNVENLYRKNEMFRLLEVGKSFGLHQFSDESREDYYTRIRNTLRRIFPWGVPQGVIKGSANNTNEI